MSNPMLEWMARVLGGTITEADCTDFAPLTPAQVRELAPVIARLEGPDATAQDSDDFNRLLESLERDGCIQGPEYRAVLRLRGWITGRPLCERAVNDPNDGSVMFSDDK